MEDNLKILISADFDETATEKQINAKIDKMQTQKIKVETVLDTKNMKNLKKQLDDIAKEQRNSMKFDQSKVTITTAMNKDRENVFDSARIDYYNEATKEQISQIYKLDVAENKLYESKIINVENNKALADAEKLANKQRLDFINNQTISLDKLKNSYSDVNGLKPLEGNNLTELNSVYDGIINKTNQLENADKTRSEEIQREIKSEIALFEQLIKSKQNAQYVATSLRTKDIKTINASEMNNLKKFEAQIKNSSVSTNDMESDVKELRMALSTAFDSDSITAYLNKLDIAKSKFGALKEESKSKNVISDNGVDLKKQSEYYSKIKKELTFIQSLKEKSINAGKNETAEINRQIKNAKGRVATAEKQIEKQKLYNEELFKANNILKNSNDDKNNLIGAKQLDKTDVDLAKESTALKNLGIQAKTAENRLDIFNKTLKGGATKEEAKEVERLKKEYQELAKAVKDGSMDSVTAKKKYSQLNNETANFKTGMQKAGRVGDSVFSKLGKNVKQFLGFLGSATIVMTGINFVKSMVEEVHNLDTAMTDLYKVTDETSERYARFITDAGVKAKTLGATITDVVNSVADFSRLGYSLEQASSLADTAILYKNVGDIGIEDSTKSIISTVKAFNIEAEKSITIVDKFNQIGNNFEISSKDIGDAMLKSASALASANNTIDESISLITAANSSVQDADVTGKMSARIA